MAPERCCPKTGDEHRWDRGVAAALLAAELRKAYTLLISAEPTLIRDARRDDLTETQMYYKTLLRDKVAEWLEPYRDDFDEGLDRLAEIPDAPR